MPSNHTDSYSTSQRALTNVVRPVLLRIATPILRMLATLRIAPNALSLIQIPLGLLMVLVIDQSRSAVLLLIMLCLVCDGLDGLLARYTNSASAYGALIDQTSDQIREVLMVAAVAQVGALPAVAAVLYGVLYPLTNVGLYLVNSRGGTVRPVFKSVLTFYPFLLVYLLGGPNWLLIGGWLTVLAMSATVAQCLRALALLQDDKS